MRLRQAIVMLVALAASASAQIRYFGGVDVGSKGTKASLFSVTTKGESDEITLIFGKTINGRLVSTMKDGRFTPVGIQDATDATKQLLADMRDEAARRNEEIRHRAQTKGSKTASREIGDVHYYVVGSSAVATAENKSELAAAIKSATDIEMDFIDSKREAYFSHNSAVPVRRRATSMYIDIGSGNTKLGCLVGGSDMKSFRDGVLPYGSVTGRTAGAKLKPEDVGAGIAEVVETEVAPAYSKQSMDTPCLSNRQRIYWTGGAAWATATLMHPERSLDAFVVMSPRDIDTFLSRLKDKSWNQRKVAPLFAKDTPEELQTKIRAKAQTEHDSVMNTFSREDLLSGVSIMKSVLASSNPSVAIVFARESSFIYGFALEKFN